MRICMNLLANQSVIKFIIFFFRKLIFLLGQLIVLNSYLNASHITLWPDLTDFVQQIIEHFFISSKIRSVLTIKVIHWFKMANTLISLINVTSRLPILKNSILHKTKIHPAHLLISLQNFLQNLMKIFLTVILSYKSLPYHK